MSLSLFMLSVIEILWFLWFPLSCLSFDRLTLDWFLKCAFCWQITVLGVCFYFLFLLCGLFIFVLLGLDGDVKFVKTCVITNYFGCRKSSCKNGSFIPTWQHILLLLLDLFSVIVNIHTSCGLEKSVCCLFYYLDFGRT